MSTLEWKSEYELGIADVDHEHRELIELINTLCDSLRSPAANDSARLLGDLCTHIGAHFALEENIMRRCQYVDYKVHKHDHDQLLEVLRDLMDDFEDRLIIDVDSFAAQLDRWFSEHFRTHDARLHRMVGGSNSPAGSGD